jgi:hypothetical protein
MDKDKPVSSEENEIKVVKLESIEKMMDGEIEAYSKILWQKLTKTNKESR